MRTVWCWRRYSVRHMILRRLKMVGFKVSLIFEIRIEIKVCQIMGLVILKVTGEDLEWSGNRKQKLVSSIKNGGFVDVKIIVEFMFEYLQMD